MEEKVAGDAYGAEPLGGRKRCGMADVCCWKALKLVDIGKGGGLAMCQSVSAPPGGGLKFGRRSNANGGGLLNWSWLVDRAAVLDGGAPMGSHGYLPTSSRQFELISWRRQPCEVATRVAMRNGLSP